MAIVLKSKHVYSHVRFSLNKKTLDQLWNFCICSSHRIWQFAYRHNYWPERFKCVIDIFYLGRAEKTVQSSHEQFSFFQNSYWSTAFWRLYSVRSLTVSYHIPQRLWVFYRSEDGDMELRHKTPNWLLYNVVNVTQSGLNGEWTRNNSTFIDWENSVRLIICGRALRE